MNLREDHEKKTILRGQYKDDEVAGSKQQQKAISKASISY